MGKFSIIFHEQKAITRFIALPHDIKKRLLEIQAGGTNVTYSVLNINFHSIKGYQKSIYASDGGEDRQLQSPFFFI